MSDFEAKLQHLTAEQIEALYSEYISGEKIALLIERYAIDVAPSSLIKTFPPTPIATLACPYCKVSLFERRKSRTVHSWNENLAFCKTCAHRHYFPGRSRWRRDCTCRPCLAAREEARQVQAVDQRKRVKAHWSLAKRKALALHTLSFTRKLQLLAMLEVRMNAQHNYLTSVEQPDHDARVSPSSAMDTAILQALHEDSVLLVDPDSPLGAFSNDLTPKAWQNKVRWIVNVSLDGQQRAGLAQLYRVMHKELSGGPLPQWHGQIIAMIEALSAEEVCAHLAARCTEHGLPFDARKKAQEVATQLLQAHPVRHVWSLANSAVRGALSYIARTHVSKRHASNTIPASMLSMGERALRQQWQFNASSYDHHAPRSSLSQLLFDVLLQQDDHGLERKISEYIAQIPAQTRAADTGYDLRYCAMCGSAMVHAQRKPQGTLVNCKDCMARTFLAQRSD
ncbi:hypothetical protein [Pseudomonas sp. KU43P]|uniref:hypothetical protein n=1 Tax=Pseudomonas sp. KU43P TaxID=2487887 RepID=UPI0012A8C2FE|nr:hypothetical protein [Pseudomonas sp. KU43P]BBH46633.1 hypothetical protein KU43P_31100 [Pseudomonas sp. KU43P]